MPRFIMLKRMTALPAFLTLLALAACGKSSSTEPDPDPVAVGDVSFAASQGTLPVLYNTELSFTSGIPAFGTSAATSLTFSANTDSAASPGFSLKTDADSASGTTAFGSCIFIFTASTFTPSPAVGDTITVNPCSISLATNGAAVGSSATLSGSFILGDVSAGGITVAGVTISSTGEVSVVIDDEPVEVGSVTIVVPTGPGS